MLIHDSCQSAIQSCLDSRTFAIARLYNDEKTMSIHIHDCYDIYFSISGGQQFLIDNRVYEFAPGDIFFINQFESHYLSKVDTTTHERVVVSIHPDYLRQFLFKVFHQGGGRLPQKIRLVCQGLKMGWNFQDVRKICKIPVNIYRETEISPCYNVYILQK